MTVELIISCCNTHQLLDIMKRNRLCDATVDFRWLARVGRGEGNGETGIQGRKGRESQREGGRREEGWGEGIQQLNFA